MGGSSAVSTTLHMVNVNSLLQVSAMLAKMGQKKARRCKRCNWGSVVVPVDLTSPWIPLSIISLLGLYMVRQFIQERRASAETVRVAPVSDEPAAATGEAPATIPLTAGTIAEEKPEKEKPKLRWRTAWIWLPFLIGFLGQTYLSLIKPMIDNAG
ncbi:MAG: hypothetical protein K9G30_02500 [Parvibaculum sp.]|nr:hypothetical protein [Parvibaculum sp.]